MAGTQYSMGFAISLDGASILLLEKNRPAFLAGQWVGVAGHVDPGETPLQAMRREAKEEADLDIEDWIPLGVVFGQTNPEDEIFMFAVRTDLSKAKTMTDEPVQVFDLAAIDRLPLALSTQEILERVREFAAQPSPLASARQLKP